MFGRRRERELQDELDFHLERAAARYGSGREAEARLGGSEAIKEECRAERRGAGWAAFGRDLRLGARILRKSPGFTLAAVAMLGLCIGMNTAAFSLISRTLLRPLPYPRPHRLVAVMSEVNGAPAPFNPLWAGDLADFRAGATALEVVASYHLRGYSLHTGAGAAAPVRAMAVGSGFFQALGVKPAQGRTFSDADGQHAVVLSDGLWRRQFGGEPALGKVVQLDGEPYTVTGIMPPSFAKGSFTDVGLFIPRVFTPAELRHDRATAAVVYAIGLLKPGATVAEANAQVAAIARREQQTHEQEKGMGAAVIPLQRYLATHGNNPLALFVFFGLSGCLLLVGCANVAGLGLSRAAARADEMAIRRALGAGRARLVRQMLTEGLLLAVLGGALGLLLSRLGMIWLNSQLAGLTASLDGWAFAITALAVAIAALVAGLPPALRLSTQPRVRAVAGGNRGRGWLVAGEITLTTAALILMASMIQGIWAEYRQPPGYDPDPVLAASLGLRGPGYAGATQQAAFIQQFQAKAAALPGVEQAALISPGPLAWSESPVAVRGRAALDWHSLPMPKVYYSTPGYFAALSIPLRRGRDFAGQDRAGQPQVVIVSETAARQMFPTGVNPLGQYIRLDAGNAPWRLVVGVCGDVISYLGDTQGNGAVYIPLAQAPQPGLSIVLRSGQPLDSLIPPLRSLLSRLAPTVALTRPGSLRAQLDENVAGDWIFLEMLLAMGGVGLLLCAVGLYSTVAFAGRQRRREIGIRLALGATPGEVERLLLRGGLQVTLAALAAGAGLGWLTVRLLEATAGPVPPGAWVRLAVPTLLLALVAAAAVYWPARRASRADPLAVLRAE